MRLSAMGTSMHFTIDGMSRSHAGGMHQDYDNIDGALADTVGTGQRGIDRE